jgi:hypothetical protein
VHRRARPIIDKRYKNDHFETITKLLTVCVCVPGFSLVCMEKYTLLVFCLYHSVLYLFLNRAAADSNVSVIMVTVSIGCVSIVQCVCVCVCVTVCLAICPNTCVTCLQHNLLTDCTVHWRYVTEWQNCAVRLDVAKIVNTYFKMNIGRVEAHRVNNS